MAIGFVLGFPCYLVTCILHYIYQMSYTDTDTGYQRLLHLFPAVAIGFVLGFPCYLVTCILHYIYIRCHTLTLILVIPEVTAPVSCSGHRICIGVPLLPGYLYSTLYIYIYQMSYTYTDTGYRRLLHLFPTVAIGFVLGFPCYLVTCILHYIYIYIYISDVIH